MKDNDNYNDNDLKEYFKRCFFAVDGLWFVMLEKQFDFKKALEIDQQVWQIFPKIQARKIRELLGLQDKTTHDLRQALEFKFEAEEYGYEVKTETDHKLEIVITECPWLKIMLESSRHDLASEMGKSICLIEYGVWAREFGVELQGTMQTRLCSDHTPCRLHFAPGEDVDH